jgi:hypothetical protein
VNTGGGGGGGGEGQLGGDGGKGVVILRTPDTSKLASTVTGATVSVVSGFYLYTFNDSGTIAWT